MNAKMWYNDIGAIYEQQKYKCKWSKPNEIWTEIRNRKVCKLIWQDATETGT